jgi:hypothetical protein
MTAGRSSSTFALITSTVRGRSGEAGSTTIAGSSRHGFFFDLMKSAMAFAVFS